MDVTDSYLYILVLQYMHFAKDLNVKFMKKQAFIVLWALVLDVINKIAMDVEAKNSQRYS